LTIVQLLWVNLIMDTLGALALATEPPSDAMMRRPPVGRGDNFITKVMWRNITGQSIYQLLVLGILLFRGDSLLQMNNNDDLLNTFVFNTFVFCQVPDFPHADPLRTIKTHVYKKYSASMICVTGFQ
jgi:Ca2+-transporting ATPase